MTAHLLAIAVGPVQDFIAAARRTRDLWLGSFLLSEVSKAVARSVEERVTQAGADPRQTGLIFPAPSDAHDLDERSSLNVANVILAELPPGCDPTATANAARLAARDRWCKFATAARSKLPSDLIRQDTWNRQLNDVIETYAAWTPLTVDYPTSRRRVMQLLAGRKQCRTFSPASEDDAGLPKSSLDGARGTVLQPPPSASRADRQENLVASSSKLRLARGEQLDVVGVTKRVAVDHLSFPSVTRVAVEPWLRAAMATGAPFERFKQVCHQLSDIDIVGTIDTHQHRQYADFRFDGTVALRNRHQDLWREAGLYDPSQPESGRWHNNSQADWQRLGEALQSLIDCKTAQGRLGEPSPYVTVLAADGDRVGEFLSNLDSPMRHREFSRELSGFAANARQIIVKHGGICVYAGGDDVLGFLPVDRGVECATELREAFVSLWKSPTWQDEPVRPTLSVGLAMAHCTEALEDLRNFGHQAEHLAKGRRDQRDGLAITLRARGGDSVECRGSWTWVSTDVPTLAQQLQDWRTLFAEERVPNKLPYDLRQMAPAYAGWSDTVAATRALQSDVMRLLKKKKGARSLEGDAAASFVARLGRVASSKDLTALVNELLIAQFLADAQRSTPVRTAASPMSVADTNTATRVSP